MVIAGLVAGCLDVADPAPDQPAARTRACQGTCPEGKWAVRWDRTSARWSPPIFEGRMTIERRDDGWAGRIRFQQSGARPAFDTVSVVGDRIDVTFHTDREQLEIIGQVRGDEIVGQMRDQPGIDWTPFTAHRI